MTDISKTLEAKSDQLNAADLADAITVTVDKVTVTDPKGDQPVQVFLKERDAGKPWKPCKTCRRVLARLWGTDASKWIGRRLTLYCDPTVKWAGEAVGGIRISHMSDIPGKQVMSMLASKGKFQKHEVEQLPTEKPKPPATAAQYKAFLTQMDAFGLSEQKIIDLCQERWQIDPKTLPHERLQKLAAKLASEVQDPGVK